MEMQLGCCHQFDSLEVWKQLGVELRRFLPLWLHTRSVVHVPSLFLQLSKPSPSKHHNLCNIYLKSESITGQPGFEIRRYNKSSWQISDSYCIKNESVCEGYSRTLFANNVHEDCSHIKNRLKGFVHVTTMKKEIVVKTVRLHLLHKCHLFPDTLVTSSLSM